MGCKTCHTLTSNMATTTVEARILIGPIEVRAVSPKAVLGSPHLATQALKRIPVPVLYLSLSDRSLVQFDDLL